MRLSLIAAILVLLVPSTKATAGPITVSLLDSTYTAIVSVTPTGGGGSTQSITTTASVPVSAALDFVNSFGDAHAQASASPIEVFVHTRAHPGRSSAVAETIIDFSPITSDTASLTLHTEWGGVTQFTSGFLSLFDVTTNELLWQFGWNTGSAIPNPMFNPYNGNVLIDQFFSAADVYRLSIRASASAAADNETALIRVSGITVPEPSTWLLLLCGLLAVLSVHRLERATAAPRAPAPERFPMPASEW